MAIGTPTKRTGVIRIWGAMTINVEINPNVFRLNWDASRRCTKLNHTPLPFSDDERINQNITFANELATLVLEHGNGQSYNLQIDAQKSGQGGTIYDYQGAHHAQLDAHDQYTNIPGIFIKGS